jgi:hypothetical protein
MGGCGLCQKHEYRNKNDLCADQRKSMVYGKSHERPKGRQGISFARSMKPRKKIRQTKQAQSGRGKQEETTQHKQYG